MREQRPILWVGDVGPLNIRKIIVPRARGEHAELPLALPCLAKERGRCGSMA